MAPARALYVERLAQFKGNEKPEVVLLVADDAELIRIIIAWTTIPVSRSEKLTTLRGGSEHDVWDWLWKNAKYSLQDLATTSGVSGHTLERTLQGLIANRILYPDGTANSFVRRYLREKVLKLFDAKPKSGAKRRA